MFKETREISASEQDSRNRHSSFRDPDRALRSVPSSNNGTLLSSQAAKNGQAGGFSSPMAGNGSQVANLVVPNLQVSRRVGISRRIKAMEDGFLAALILLVASPWMLLIALGVKLDSPGPVLFRQKRHGWDGTAIEIYKFRTMVMHEETAGQVTQARKDDARVTRFGAFLRRTSLDELPQFVNVLQGRMSIVGPRPHAVEHNEQYQDLIDTYTQRHRVKPGITGWAQVNGWRGETDTLEKMQKRVEYDLYYIKHWSLWFDMKIIFLTLTKGLFHPNAY
jgi:putative colanic acid biosysnthesis UDP-glucose lipid carrier transferase